MAPTQVFIGHTWDLYSIGIGIIIILIAVILFMLLKKGRKYKFVNLRKEIQDGNEGISEAVKLLKDKTLNSLKNINDVLDDLEKNG